MPLRLRTRPDEVRRRVFGRALRERLRPCRDDTGVTLIELLIAIVLLGVVTAPLANVAVVYLRTSDATVARLAESSDAQLVGAYFGRDVASIGVRDTTSLYDPPLTQSVDDTNSASWPYPCASTGTTPVVRFAWDEYDSTDPSHPVVIRVRVAYVLDNGNTELRRLKCAGSTTSNLLLARDLDPCSPDCKDPKPPAIVTCSSTCTGPVPGCEPPCPPPVPAAVTLTLTIKDSANRGSGYTITFTGQRRQT
jgi:prepilin-type N-terminal cleavage/methylation domain-containing protein